MRDKFGKFLDHFLERLRFSDFSNLLDLVDEITAGSELAVLMLMKISANFLSEGWLITYKLINSVSKETGLTVATETLLSPALTKFYLPLGGRILTNFVVDYCHTH